ncbi:homeobox-leucine zipper protein MERISTEM L1-like [Setaria italica]|uniref:homeobox-leucine zipper protein MERISTEM L1-like n=1 Tax=Setaria italica TaxID=4555 RepID=UPI000BE556AE|nr:homeobox-leucine zipper protein MERISTEM L1-like [Setaria italica]
MSGNERGKLTPEEIEREHDDQCLTTVPFEWLVDDEDDWKMVFRGEAVGVAGGVPGVGESGIPGDGVDGRRRGVFEGVAEEVEEPQAWAIRQRRRELDTMDNEWQLNSNNEQGMGLNPGNETAYPNWINHMEEYDIDALLGAEDHVNTDQDEDDEEHHHDGSKSSKRGKNRFTAKQIEQLESLFQLSAHPDDPTRQELADKIGLEARQVKFWFQNRRTKTKAKAVGDQNKDIKQENAQLHAENMKLQQTLACGRCRDPTEHKWHLLNENARLKDTKRRAQEYLIKLIHDSNLPHSETLEHLESASLNLVPFDDNGSTYQATLLSYAERALNEFMMLAVKDEPMWLPTINGKMLHNQEYNCRTCPGLLGPCPQGFVMEATKQTTTVRGTASDLVAMLTDVSCWSKMFPGIIESVRASKVVSSGISTSRDGLIQEA